MPLLMLLALLGILATAGAVDPPITLYLSPSGDDADAGDALNPLLTLDGVLGKAADASEITLRLLAGTYDLAPNNVSFSGDLEHFVLVGDTANPADVVLGSSSGAPVLLVRLVGVQFIIEVESITFASFAPVLAEPRERPMAVSNCVVDGYSAANGVLFATTGRLNVTDVRVTNSRGGIFQATTHLAVVDSSITDHHTAEGPAAVVTGVEGATLELVGTNITGTNGTSLQPGSNGTATVVATSAATARIVDSIISDNFQCGAVDITKGDVEVAQSTLWGNSCGASGGALRVHNGTSLSVIDSYVRANSAFEAGGAIYFSPDPAGTAATPVLLLNTTFVNNTAGTDGGAVVLHGGPVTVQLVIATTNTAGAAQPGLGGAFALLDFVFSDPSSLTVTDCTLQGNSAASGGGIAVAPSLSTFPVTVGGSTFRDNQGGALELLAGTAPATFDDCRFVNNEATGGGGAIRYRPQIASAPLNITGCMFDNNNSGYDGGAVYARSGPVLVESTTFRGNVATGGRDGGALSLANFDEPADSWITVRDTTFDRNRADSDGGALEINPFVEPTGVEFPVLIDNCTFTSNMAESDDGGALDIYAGPVQVVDTVFDSNIAGDDAGALYLGFFASVSGDVTLLRTTFTNNTADDKGGAIYHEVVTDPARVALFDITLTMFADNTAGDEGGAMLCDQSNLALTLQNATFERNHGDDSGGALAMSPGSTDVALEVYDSSFVDNYSGNSGGAIHTHAHNGTLSRNVFHRNVAKFDGGHLDLDDSVVMLVSDSTFSDSVALRDGAAIYSTDSSLTLVDVTLTNSTGNEAALYGQDMLMVVLDRVIIEDSENGGVDIVNAATGVEIIDSTIANTTAGFGVRASTVDGPVTILRTEIRDNSDGGMHLRTSGFAVSVRESRFVGNVDAGSDGGGLRITSSALPAPAEIIDCVFQDNESGREGGGAAVFVTPLVVRGTTMTGNRADDAGALLWAEFLEVGGNSSMLMESCTVSNNTADSRGGALWIRDDDISYGAVAESPITLRNVTMSHNTADSDGGALEVEVGPMLIEDSFFSYNRGDDGGVMEFQAVVTSNADLVIRNSTFLRNSADDTGAVTFYPQRPAVFNVTDCTFSYNTADDDAGAVRLETDDTIVTFRNTLFYRNTAADDGGGIAISADAKVSILSSTFRECAAEEGGAVDSATENGVYIEDTTMEANQANRGGDIFTFYGGIEIVRSTFTQSQLRPKTTPFGPQHVGTSIYHAFACSLEIRECHFFNITGTSAAVYSVGLQNDNMVHIIDTTFEQCRGTASSGALVVSGTSSNVVINGTTFKDNYGAAGGALLIRAPALVAQCTFTNNTGLDGGAVYINLSFDLVFQGCRFEGNLQTDYPNWAVDGGGAVSIFMSRVVFRDTVFIHNSATKWGGAVSAFLNSPSQYAHFERCEFEDNTVVQHNGSAVAAFGSLGEVSVEQYEFDRPGPFTYRFAYFEYYYYGGEGGGGEGYFREGYFREAPRGDREPPLCRDGSTECRSLERNIDRDYAPQGRIGKVQFVDSTVVGGDGWSVFVDGDVFVTATDSTLDGLLVGKMAYELEEPVAHQLMDSSVGRVVLLDAFSEIQCLDRASRPSTLLAGPVDRDNVVCAPDWYEESPPEPIEALSFPGSVQNGTILLLHGGSRADGTYSDALYAFHTASLAWALVDTDSRVSRWKHGLVSNGTDLVAIWGEKSGNVLTDVWMFSPGAGWSIAAIGGTPARPRFGFAHATVGSLVYVLGGRLSDALVSDFFDVLDLASGEWGTPLAAAPSARVFATLTAYNQTTLFLFGGFDGSFAALGDLWAYDIGSDIWTMVATTGDAPPARGLHHAAILANSFLYVMGGRTAEADTTELGTYLLVLATSEWQCEAPSITVPAQQSGGALALAGTRVLRVGGQDHASNKFVGVFSLAALPSLDGSGSVTFSQFTAAPIDYYYYVFGPQFGPPPGCGEGGGVEFLRRRSTTLSSLCPPASGLPTLLVFQGAAGNTQSDGFFIGDELCYDMQCGPVVAFSFVAPIADTLEFSTDGSSFDTVLMLKRDTGSCTLECDDDGGSGTRSRIVASLGAGEAVTVIVGGYGGNSGNYQIGVFPTGGGPPQGGGEGQTTSYYL